LFSRTTVACKTFEHETETELSSKLLRDARECLIT